MPFSPKVIKCQETLLKVNESRYIVVYLASGSIKNRFPIDCVNIYLLSIFFSVHFSNKCVNVYLFSICFQQIQLSVKVWRYHLRMFTGIAENGLKKLRLRVTVFLFMIWERSPQKNSLNFDEFQFSAYKQKNCGCKLYCFIVFHLCDIGFYDRSNISLNETFIIAKR